MIGRHRPEVDQGASLALVSLVGALIGFWLIVGALVALAAL